MRNRRACSLAVELLNVNISRQAPQMRSAQKTSIIRPIPQLNTASTSDGETAISYRSKENALNEHFPAIAIREIRTNEQNPSNPETGLLKTTLLSVRTELKEKKFCPS